MHGGWGGGWEWRAVADLLVAGGHEAYRPSLTGHGERRHLANAAVDLDTHIADIVNLLDIEELVDVVLVGQSYGGAVVTGAADRAPARIGHVAYVDAFVPRDGESVNALSPPAFASRLRTLAAEHGDGWAAPVPFASDELGTPPELAEWYFAKLVPQSLATLEQPLRLTGAIDRIPRTFIDCATDPGRSIFRRFAERAQAEGWRCRALPVGHDAQVIAPDRLAGLLVELA